MGSFSLAVDKGSREPIYMDGSERMYDAPPRLPMGKWFQLVSLPVLRRVGWILV